jgi:hypothetical protein
VIKLIVILLVSACGMLSRQERTAVEDISVTKGVSAELLNRYVGDWPLPSRTAAEEMITKYGVPFESTSTMLIWRERTPFKRITVYREQVIHKFPIKHYDILEHVIDFRIPAEQVDELAKFNGSMTYDITRGELSARCDQEAMNILALNLGSDILRGKIDYSQARIEFGRLAIEYLNGNIAPQLIDLQFRPAENTAQSDEYINIAPAQAEQSKPTYRADDL